MAFPDVIVECAFDNDINEVQYAQGGYSDITQFVKSINGTLRGRQYELDTVETGSLSITLDNADGRFTPGKVDSPYYPNVKPARRLRIRGRNLQRSQIATAGSTLRSTVGFQRDTNYASNYPTGPVLVESRVDGVSPLRTVTHTNEIQDPRTTSTALWAGTLTKSLPGDGWLRLTTPDAAVRYIYASPSPLGRFPVTAGDKVALRMKVRGHATRDLYVKLAVAGYDSANAGLSPYPTGGYVLIPATQEVTVTLMGTMSTAGTVGTLPLIYLYGTTPGGVPVAGDYVDVTEWYYEHGTNAPTDIDVNDLFFAGDDEEHLNVDGTATDYRWKGTANASGSEQTSHPVGAGTHHIEVTVPSGTPAGGHGLVQWNVPLEQGRLLHHVVRVRRVSGTEPTGSAGVTVRYFDADDNLIGPTAPGNGYSLPTSSSYFDMRGYGGHTPPPTAAYALMDFHVSPTAAYTSDVVYAFDAIQTESAENHAPNPTGRWDAKDWYVTGAAGTVPTNGTLEIIFTAAADGGDSELYTWLAGMIPGETYTAYLQLYHTNTSTGGTPTTSLQVTADDGQTATVVGGKAVYEAGVYTFTATRSNMKLAIQPEGGGMFPAGHYVKVKLVNVKLGDTSPGAYVETDYGTWEHPKPIFEGWIESWPLRVTGQAPEMTVVANDRLKRIGQIKLDSTWREAVFDDAMELIIPFDDDPVDARGRVAQIGTWASTDQIIDIPLLATVGDLGAAGYTLGVDGPATPTAIDFNAVSGTQGYFVQMDYSKDYTPPAAPPPPPPSPTPPPPAQTYTYVTYTKTYYSTWSRTFDGSGATTWDDSDYCYQGYYDGNRGLTRSLVGFNYNAIKSDLAGATIKSCKFTARNEHWYYNAGGTAYLGTHTYSSKPSSWSTSSVAENRLHTSWGKGATKTVELGVTIGNEFKAGTTKGVAFGPPPYGLSYYGYFRGAKLSYRPYLTITYVKKVAT